DQVLQDLGGKAPLQAAHTPGLDSMAEHHFLSPAAPGLQETSFAGLVMGVETLAPIAPAPLEALARGFRLHGSQVAFTCRLISVGDDTVVDVSDGLASDSEGQACFQALNEALDKAGMHFIPTGGPLGVCISDHPALKVSCEAFCRLNPVDSIGCSWMSQLPGAGLESTYQALADCLAGLELNELRLDLEEDPINGLLLYGGGLLPQLPAVDQAVEIWSPRPTYLGIAKLLQVPWKNLGPEHQRFDHARMVLDKLDEWIEQKEQVMVDLPYLWQSTYKGDLLEKVKTIEWLDRELISPLLKRAIAGDLELRVRSLSAVDIRSGACCAGLVDAWTVRAAKPSTLV
ncbi:MAG: hypothetical protein KDK78_06770, partial [Chlamydiia bacterium]|nr:hypothetical protein [Chlamydiia bacterium]